MMRYAMLPGLAVILAAALASCSNAPQAPPRVNAVITQGTVNVSLTSPANAHVLPPLSSGNTVNVTLALIDKVVEISPGMKYRAWTFNGAVPGPVIHVRVGDTVNVTLTNKASMGHSIDFHAALAPPNVAYQTVAPGETLRFSWVATSPGAFLYHCGTPPVLAHISNGMYGAIIVDPPNGWGDDAQSFVFVQSEFYPKQVPGTDQYEGDLAKMITGPAQVVVFNGQAFRYETVPLAINVGQPVRVFIVNAGPSHFSAFHVIGTLFQQAFIDGNPANRLVGLQTLNIPPGGGEVAEFTVHQAGNYTFVTHAFGDADAGAMGMFVAR
ncbi:MAG TPA: multicopper oxidase domain-containing protein [Candidatus Aquilonibacter sp.]